jgi:serine/threonine protein kinase
VIGPYKLLEQIGEGGFGVVFLAEQMAPVRRKVALKIIKPGMDTRQVIARFEAERQALAMMDHPNIAKVLDAGKTGAGSTEQRAGSPEGFLLHAPSSPLSASSGRPYFVMELVQGVSITEYCDQCNLATRERLQLFITVCQAVQHAHQKGIIHRDIKPTNVLVAIQDGRPAPKIIDFGGPECAINIVLAPEAVDDLNRLKANVRADVKDGIEKHLRHEPTKVSKSRIKRVRGLRRPQYRLRINEIRVFYDVSEDKADALALVEKSAANEWLERHGER